MIALPRPEVVHLPYSEVLARVREGNVARVVISGDDIQGELVTPITVPSPPGSSTTTTVGSPPTFDRFETVFPEAVGDPDLLATLEDHGVVVDATGPSNGVVGLIVANLLPLLLLVGVLVWIGRRTMQSQAGMAEDQGASEQIATRSSP